MSIKSVLLVECFLSLGLFGHVSAAYGEKCATDTDCTTNDHTTCMSVHSNCPSKACTGCATGYELALDKSSCKASIGTTCSDVDNDCLINTAAHGLCSTTCQCAASHTYDSSKRACIPDTDKKFGDPCTEIANCYIKASDHGKCSTVCGCEEGYIEGDGHECRVPVYGETCKDGGVACGKQSTDTSENVPTCTSEGTSHKCKCDTATYDDTTVLGLNLCLTKKTTGLLVNGFACTEHKDCESKFCYACPGAASDKICVGAEPGKSSTTRILVHPLWILAATLLQTVIQL